MMLKYSLHINEKTKTYEVYFRVPNENGKLKQIHKSTKIKAKAGNKHKAEEQAQMIVSKYEYLVYSDKSNMLLCDYVSDWLERQKPMLSHTTYDNYVSMLKRHITPYFTQHSLKLIEVKPYHLQEYINTKLEAGLSPNTVIKHLAVIQTALQDALCNDIIRSNPAHKVRKPKRVKPQHNFYSSDEIKKLFAVAETSPIKVPIYISALFGLRRGEVIGLKWSDIDLEHKTLTINGSITRQQQSDGKWVDVYSNVLKTESSHGTYRLNDTVCNYFKQLYKDNQSIVSNIDDKSEYVCVNAIGERFKLDYITSTFPKLLKTNGLKHIRFHDLRHSALSLLSLTYSMKDVQMYGRHANFNITADTYCHIDNAETAKELDTLCTAFGLVG